MSDIDNPADDRIEPVYRCMPFWDRGFEVAKRWYHEEWDGSYIQLTLARDIAQAIEVEVERALTK